MTIVIGVVIGLTAVGVLLIVVVLWSRREQGSTGKCGCTHFW